MTHSRYLISSWSSSYKCYQNHIEQLATTVCVLRTHVQAVIARHGLSHSMYVTLNKIKQPNNSTKDYTEGWPKETLYNYSVLIHSRYDAVTGEQLQHSWRYLLLIWSQTASKLCFLGDWNGIVCAMRELHFLPPPPWNEGCVCPVVTTCSLTFDGTFSLERQHCFSREKTTRLSWWKKESPPLPQKNLEQKSEWRSRQQTCRGGRKYPQEAHKSRVVSRKGRGRKEGGRAGEKMSRQCPLCICWVSRRAFVMLYADPLPKAAAGLRVQLFCYSLSPLFLSLSLFCDFFVFLFFICDCRVDYYPQAADYRQSDDKIKVN